MFLFRTKIRININRPLKPIEQQENEKTHATIDTERIFTIQAAIVRIMKARQTLSRALLINEVIEQLRQRFQPDVSHIEVNKSVRFQI